MTKYRMGVLLLLFLSAQWTSEADEESTNRKGTNAKKRDVGELSRKVPSPLQSLASASSAAALRRPHFPAQLGGRQQLVSSPNNNNQHLRDESTAHQSQSAQQTSPNEYGRIFPKQPPSAYGSPQQAQAVDYRNPPAAREPAHHQPQYQPTYQQQQSFTVSSPQAPQVAQSYNNLEEYGIQPVSPGKGRRNNSTTQSLSPRSELENALHRRRAKRRCPREALLLDTVPPFARTARSTHQHRVTGETLATEYVGGPLRESARAYARRNYARPANAPPVPFSTLVGPEYGGETEAAPPPPPHPPHHRPRGKPKRPQVPASPFTQELPLGSEGNQWAFIARPPKKHGGRGRGKPTPAPPTAHEAGGVGHYLTTLPPGTKGFHYPGVNSKNLPSVQEAHRYYYPPRMPLPLPTCFHNPTGYPCCNPTLNDLMVETYTDLEAKPKFHTCNINAIAQHLQVKAEERFNTSFETVAAFDDFAQKIHFYGDLVCKVELGGKFMLAYATVKDVEKVLSPEQVEGALQSQQNGGGGGGGGGGPSSFPPVAPSSGGTAPPVSYASSTPAYPAGAAAVQRKKRGAPAANTEAQFIGPLLPPPLNDLSRRYTMWI